MSSGYKRKLDEEIARKYESCPSCGRRDKQPCATCEECPRCCKCQKTLPVGTVVYQARFQFTLDNEDVVRVYEGKVSTSGPKMVIVDWHLITRERFTRERAGRDLHLTKKQALAKLFRVQTDRLESARRKVKDEEKKLELVKVALATEQKVPDGCICGSGGDMRCPVHGLLT